MGRVHEYVRGVHFYRTTFSYIKANIFWDTLDNNNMAHKKRAAVSISNQKAKKTEERTKAKSK